MVVDDLMKQKKINEKNVEMSKLDLEITDMKLTIVNHEKAIEHCNERITSLEGKKKKMQEELSDIQDTVPLKAGGNNG